MNKTIQQCSTINKDTQDRCSQWVDEVVKVASSPSDNGQKRKNESEVGFETDSEFDSVSECGGKRRKFAVPQKAEKLNLTCEWKNCHFNCESLDLFLKHVANHVPELDVRITDDNETYGCLWSGCSYENPNGVDMMRHVNYHSFHTKLKSIGTNVKKRTKLPKCTRDTDWQNILDTLPSHTCNWENCGQTFNNYQLYIYHVLSHIESNPRGNKIDGGISCEWIDCKCRYPSLYKLKEHVRVHTKEKIIACPNCGSTFASNTKFNLHCKRQIPLEAQGFQCSHCNKFYPTECILREHMRCHVFCYKCNQCGMSCDSPSSLSKHILYRHSDIRKFPCNVCTYATKTQKDLDSHMTTHGQNFECDFDGCNYFCKNSYTLERHIEKAHRSEIRWYCCHECPVQYRKSYRLTRHLIEVHHLQWLNGHKRFQYILEEDGCYRLQTVRYESVHDPLDTTKENNANVEMEKNLLSTQQESLQNLNETKVSVPCILISIDEIDEQGNIISSKIIETQETTMLPPSIGAPIILT